LLIYTGKELQMLCLKSIKEKELDLALFLLAKHRISYECLNLKREIKGQQKLKRRV